MPKNTFVWKPVNKHELVQKGKAIYEGIKDKLEKEHKGEVVAIEVESGDYFLGKRGVEAVRKARKKYPNKLFYLVRIGFPVYASFR